MLRQAGGPNDGIRAARGEAANPRSYLGWHGMRDVVGIVAEYFPIWIAISFWIHAADNIDILWLRVDAWCPKHTFMLETERGLETLSYNFIIPNKYQIYPVHRWYDSARLPSDIKPEQCLMTSCSDVYIGDFWHYSHNEIYESTRDSHLHPVFKDIHGDKCLYTTVAKFPGFRAARRFNGEWYGLRTDGSIVPAVPRYDIKKASIERVELLRSRVETAAVGIMSEDY